jgi:protein gp37
MSKCPQHTFYILTKRPERLAKCWDYISRALEKDVSPGKKWFGVTAWDQDSVNNAIGPLIIDNPGYNTFLSLEPLLGPITLQTFGEYLEEWLPNWIIVGGETGPKARPMQSEWVRSIRDQCVEAGVPFWFKSWGAWIPDVKPGDDPHMLKYLLDGQTWHQRPEEV